MNFQRIYLTSTSGSQVAIYRTGVSGPAVFVLGGLQGQSTAQTPIASILEAAAGFGARVAMMDLPGTGKSSYRGALTMELWLDDICEVYRSLEFKQGIWIGASLGAWLMLLLHRRNPAWFGSMCALAPAIDWDKNYVLPGIRSGKFTETQESVALGALKLPKSLVQSMSAHHVLDAAFKIQVPLHIIQGERDDTALPDITKRLAIQLGAQCTLELLEDDDHALAKLATPTSLDRFARWLRQELDRIAA
jgi:pimeloyl-ACP methyl ester carboxylesterase